MLIVNKIMNIIISSFQDMTSYIVAYMIITLKANNVPYPFFLTGVALHTVNT